VLLTGCSSSTSSSGGKHGTGSASGSSDNGTDSGTGSTGSGTGSTGSGTGSTGSGTAGDGSGNGTGAGGTSGDAGSANAGTANAGAAGSLGKIPIGTTQCSDGKDNDGDGLIDSADPECTGPLDNDESSFGTGIPGDNMDPKWQDCFFDGNSGAGDDGCRYSTGCLTGALSPTDKDCQVTDQCRKFCEPLTPNGCDCFGCCAITKPDGSVTHVEIASTCTYADIDDPSKCPVCTPNSTCENTCGHCELCIGKTELPADCTNTGTGGSTGAGGASSSGGASNGGTTSTGGAAESGGSGGACVVPTCDTGAQGCGVPCAADCLPGWYCLTGCCIPSIR
jgi:hypothetical protein